MTTWTPLDKWGDEMTGQIMDYPVVRSLNDVMDFDLTVRVLPDGTVDDDPGVNGPMDLTIEVDDDGQSLPTADASLHEQAQRQGWSLITGFTGQFGYQGPCMHQSEVIGGGLAEWILSRPGLYVAVALYTDGDNEDGPTEWTVAYREEA